jgi:hypothetical protein
MDGTEGRRGDIEPMRVHWSKEGAVYCDGCRWDGRLLRIHRAIQDIGP